jgi:hypothetical protein
MLDPRTLGNGCEQYEEFTIRSRRKTKKKIQYDYRHTDGELYSTVSDTLEKCQKAKNEWVIARKGA